MTRLESGVLRALFARVRLCSEAFTNRSETFTNRSETFANASERLLNPHFLGGPALPVTP